jgi:hypothetical protein
MKRLGPELKMPDLKVPPFLADVYYDMRDRRLLPVVALVVVAIAAVPFLMGGSDEPMPAETPEQAAESVRLEIEDDSALAVVEAKPGLRDYRKRLRGRTPTDPFKQRYTGVPAGVLLESTESSEAIDAEGGGSSGDVSVTEVDETTTEIEEPGSSSPEAGGSPGSGTSPGSAGGGSADGGSGSGNHDPNVDPDGMRFFGFRPDVRFGVAGSQDLTLHEDLPLGSLLPKRDPLLVFIGVSENGKRAAFDVSPEVTRVRGDGACIGGKQSCRLLFMNEGDAVDLLTETSGRAFRLKVESIDFVEVDVPKQSNKSGSASGSVLRRSLGLAQNFSK